MKKIAIIIDLNHIVLNIDYTKALDKFAEHRLHIADDDTFHLLLENFNLGRMNTDDLYEEFCKLYCHSQSLKKHQFIEAWNAMLLNIPQARSNIDYLFRLKQKEYCMILMCDLNEIHAAKIASNQGFFSLFDKTFYSFRTGILKSDAASLVLPVEYLNKEKQIDNRSILVIDNNLINVVAAASLNLMGKKYSAEPDRGVCLESLLEGFIAFPKPKFTTIPTPKYVAIPDTLFALPKVPVGIQDMIPGIDPSLRIHH